MKARAKHIFSIYKKLQRSGLTLDELDDVYAARVIVNTIDQCYEVYAKLIAHFKHFPNAFDDYIQSPKKSGYQSLHGVIASEAGCKFEIQVRTQAMDNAAERGVAFIGFIKLVWMTPR